MEKIPRNSEPPVHHPARRDNILLCHVRLSTAALVLPVSRSGRSIHAASGGSLFWHAHRVCAHTQVQIQLLPGV